MISDFCAEYLRLQGVIILPQARKPSASIEARPPEQETVKIPGYERDLS